jgi:CcmD family protein
MKGMFMRAVISVLLLIGLFVAAPALAQEPAAQPDSAQPSGESPAEERAAQFVGVTGPDAESVPGGTLMLVAYAVVWVLLFLFLLRMRGLQRQTAEELERLSAEIRATEAR